MNFCVHFSDSTKMNKLISQNFKTCSTRLHGMLSRARKVTICLDGWTKKGLSSSFLGVSACFFNPLDSTPRHVFLNIHELSHPHTGDAIAAWLKKTLDRWTISQNKVQLIVTDSGSNMLKAIKVLQIQYADEAVEPVPELPEVDHVEAATDAQNVQEGDNEGPHEPAEESEDDEDDSEEENDADDQDETESETDFAELPEIVDDDNDLEKIDLPPSVPYRRMACMSHTLQLIVKPAYKHYETILTKTRSLVGKIRKSSVATEKLVQKCGKTLVTDCTTRWNSTHEMVKRLLAIRSSVDEVLTAIGLFISIHYIQTQSHINDSSFRHETSDN